MFLSRTESTTAVPPLSGELCTEKSLVEDFKKLGIERDDTIIVHASVKSLGYVCGGPYTVIKALLEVLGKNGTLVVATQSGDNSDPAQWKDPPVPQEWWQAIRDSLPAYDAQITGTRRMGAVAETLRNWPGAERSGHPQTSFAAVGVNAVEITKDHALDSMLGEKSPLAKLEHFRAKVLLLGVGFDKCTAFHLAEYRNDAPRAPNSFAVNMNGHRTWITVTDVDVKSHDFARIGKDFSTKRQLTTGKVGAANCHLFPFAEAVNYASIWIRSNR